jgi:hypothetical protein
METPTMNAPVAVSATTELQNGLNDVLRQKIRNRISIGAATGQAAIERLIAEGKIAADFIAPIGVNQKTRGELPVVTFDSNGTLKMNIPTGQYNIAEMAMYQLGSRFGIPTGYLLNLSKVDDNHRMLAARILNDHTGWTEKSRALIRTVGSDVRGVMSDSYRRLDSQQIVKGFIENVYSNGAVIADGHMDNSKLWIESLIPEPINIPTMKNGLVSIAFGVALRNSDYGDGALELRSFLMQGVCLNGMVRESVMREIHLGKKLPDDLALSEEAYRSDSETQRLIVRDLTNQLLGRDTIERRIAEIQRAGEYDINPENELRNMLKAGKINQGEMKGIEQLFMRSAVDDGMAGESTLWKLTQGITAFARESENRRGRELQAIAGDLMNRIQLS